MRWITRAALGGALAAALGSACAQAAPPAPATPQNVLQLSATGSVDVQQDLLTVRLQATREGADAAAVQAQIKSVLEAALAEARRGAQAGELDVRTGNFSLYPRSSREGRIAGWVGSAELVLEGRDVARVSQLAGRLPGMTVSQVAFSLSRQQRQAVEAQAQQEAIDRFKARAADLARGFGFSGYSLREVSVDTAEPGFMPRPMRSMAMEAKAASADAPVPVEAGKATVTVTVSGSVQLR